MREQWPRMSIAHGILDKCWLGNAVTMVKDADSVHSQVTLSQLYALLYCISKYFWQQPDVYRSGFVERVHVVSSELHRV
jgi:hypothetical protein